MAGMNVKKGDRVMTTAGIVGVVTNLEEGTNNVTVRTASTTLIEFDKSAILRVLNVEAKPEEKK